MWELWKILQDSFVSVTLNVFEVPTPPGAKLLER